MNSGKLARTNVAASFQSAVADDGRIGLREEFQTIVQAFKADLQQAKTPGHAAELRDGVLRVIRGAKFTDGSERRTVRWVKTMDAFAVLLASVGTSRDLPSYPIRWLLEAEVKQLAQARITTLAERARMESAFSR